MIKTISGACLGLGLLCLASSAPAQSFIYVANEDSASVSAYTASPLGVLTTVAGSPFTAGIFPTAVAVDPHLKFAYASNAGDNTVTAYTINSSTGALTLLASYSTEPNPQALAVDPTGRFLYVTSYNNSDVAGYRISATGALTALPGSPYPAGSGTLGIAVSSSGKSVYVVNQSSHNISGYLIDSNTGALTAAPGSPYHCGNEPRNVTVDPSGKFVYVGNLTDNNVSGYKIDGTTQALNPIAGSPFAAGGAPYFVASNGKFAYVPNQNDGNVTGYAVDALSGALTVLPGSPFPAGGHPTSIGFNSSGTFAYVANFDNANVRGYSINSSTGGLTELAASPFAAAAGPNWVSMVPKLSVQLGSATGNPILINTSSSGKLPVTIGPVITWDLANCLTSPCSTLFAADERGVRAASAAAAANPDPLDLTTVTFGATGTEPSLDFCTPRDTNSKDNTVMCHFDTQKMGLKPGDTIVQLRGTTIHNIAVWATAPVTCY